MFRTMQSASACLHRLPSSGGSELGSRLCQPLKLTDGCQTDFSARTQAATPLKAAALNVQRSRKKGEEWFSDRATLINGHPGHRRNCPCIQGVNIISLWFLHYSEKELLAPSHSWKHLEHQDANINGHLNKASPPVGTLVHNKDLLTGDFKDLF